MNMVASAFYTICMHKDGDPRPLPPRSDFTFFPPDTQGWVTAATKENTMAYINEIPDLIVPVMFDLWRYRKDTIIEHIGDETSYFIVNYGSVTHGEREFFLGFENAFSLRLIKCGSELIKFSPADHYENIETVSSFLQESIQLLTKNKTARLGCTPEDRRAIAQNYTDALMNTIIQEGRDYLCQVN